MARARNRDLEVDGATGQLGDWGRYEETRSNRGWLRDTSKAIRGERARRIPGKEYRGDGKVQVQVQVQIQVQVQVQSPGPESRMRPAG
ncbi:uncharacterized protein N7482_008638 [Penicillium canariense]|uniref:Uncharacterized protein n=1 Tax=Penicillium canariense TaxID=189055 RepID=A0A9W9HTK7_9EURO|nr:uncharacterized protein N7482_008638 [Penicillium canariense]KAJ5157538.1 hypothetical protein N7482_008638 [Penicillium canariense]